MKVIALVPAYNEEKTIADVLRVLIKHRDIDDIIAIDDGSVDSTAKIIKQFNVKCVFLKNNKGKGDAVKMATASICSDVILFIDADLIGLKKKHIDLILQPILQKKAAMVIGLRDKGNSLGNMIMPYFPLTGGERAILTDAFREIRKNPLIKGWGLESVMNDYCRKKGLKIVKVPLHGLDHIGLQTKKYGWGAFLKEIYDVGMTQIKLLKVRYE